MGFCYKCEKKTEQMCVGCGSMRRYVCLDCVLPCAWCGDEGPYCANCAKCKKENQNHCGEPGNHVCLSCDKLIPVGGPRAKCATCDEFYYHLNCMQKCACGAPHYLCDCPWNVEHSCQYEGCEKFVCEQNCQLSPILPGREELLLCPEHHQAAIKDVKAWLKGQGK